MTFEADPVAQLQVIRDNVHGCRQTPPREKRVCVDVIDNRLAGKASASATLLDVVGIQSDLRDAALAQDWYFKGQPKEVPNGVGFSTRRKDALVDGYVRGLMADDEDMTEPEAQVIAQQMYAELTSPIGRGATVDAFDTVALHRPGSPMWIAALDEEAMLGNLQLLPARLGLAPDPVLPTSYVLMKVSTDQGALPRFADSGGFPYWRPGGVTHPISLCPAGHLGFPELVIDGIQVRHVNGPLLEYERSV